MAPTAPPSISPCAAAYSTSRLDGISTDRYVPQPKPALNGTRKGLTEGGVVIQGGPYENFAGRDASRGLACQSFDEEMLTADLTAPLDDLKTSHRPGGEPAGVGGAIQREVSRRR